jgi:hypothetical protein
MSNVDPKLYESEIKQFFDLEKPVPRIFKNGKKLREEYIEREEFLKKISLCNGCELVQFRAYFITQLLDSVKPEPVV